MSDTDLILQGALFTAGALLFVLVSAWWLYLSPMGRRVTTETPSVGFVRTVAAALGAATLLLFTGALWDASMHIQTGRIPAGADFLWPPHLLLYSGFLLSLLVAVAALVHIARGGWARGERDPRAWVRSHPYVGAVGLAAMYELMAIPGDALWHQLFGADLTAWSPPHVMLGAMGSLVVLCAVALVSQSGALDAQGWRSGWVIALLGLMLNIALVIGVLEWELPVRTQQVNSQPLWYYPVVSGALQFFTLVLARRLAPVRWAATLTAIAFYVPRVAVITVLQLTDGIAPAVPPLFIGGAILLDLIGEHRHDAGLRQAFVEAAAYTAGFAVVALPMIAARGNLPHFTTAVAGYAVAGVFLAALALWPLAQLIARHLLTRRHTAHPAVLRGAAVGK